MPQRDEPDLGDGPPPTSSSGWGKNIRAPAGKSSPAREKKRDAVRAGKGIADDTGEIVEGVYIELIRPDMTYVTRYPPL